MEDNKRKQSETNEWQGKTNEEFEGGKHDLKTESKHKDHKTHEQSKGQNDY